VANREIDEDLEMSPFDDAEPEVLVPISFTKPELDEAWRLAQQKVISGEITTREFHRVSLWLANDYLELFNDMASCIKLFNRVPMSYFQKDIFDDSQADPEFSAMADNLARKIEDLSKYPGILNPKAKC